ncbi:T9SS type A sorting domain-containing protein [Bacteroidota bacterium]
MKKMILIIVVLLFSHQIRAEEYFDFFSAGDTEGFLFDSQNNPIIYHYGITKTTDNGQSWVDILTHNIFYNSDSTESQCNHVKDLLIVNDSVLLADHYIHNVIDEVIGIYGAGILKTSNGGKDWYHVNSKPGYTFALDSNGNILAGVDSCLMRSTDYGETWLNIENSILELGSFFKIKRIAVSSSNDIYIFAVAGENEDNYILRSEDNCNTWDEIYYTENGGSWKVGIIDLVADFKDNIYVLTSHLGIQFSSDKGKNWDNFISDTDIFDFYYCHALVFTKENIPVAIFGRDIYMNINNRWKLLRRPLSLNHDKLAIDKEDFIFLKEYPGYDIYKSKAALDKNMKKLDLSIANEQKICYRFAKNAHRGDTVNLNLSLKGLFDERIDDADLSISFGSISNTFTNVFDDKGIYEYKIVIRDTCKKNISVVFQSYKDGYFDSEKAIANIYIDTITTRIEWNEQASDEFNFEIAPNPTENFFKIYCANQNPVTVKMSLYDILGNYVLENKYYIQAREYSKEIDISGLQPGVYFVRVEAGGQAYYEKLIVL